MKKGRPGQPGLPDWGTMHADSAIFLAAILFVVVIVAVVELIGAIT